jgi:hypothetical protein
VGFLLKGNDLDEYTNSNNSNDDDGKKRYIRQTINTELAKSELNG